MICAASDLRCRSGSTSYLLQRKAVLPAARLTDAQRLCLTERWCCSAAHVGLEVCRVLEDSKQWSDDADLSKSASGVAHMLAVWHGVHCVTSVRFEWFLVGSRNELWIRLKDWALLRESLHCGWWQDWLWTVQSPQQNRKSCSDKKCHEAYHLTFLMLDKQPATV